MLKTSRAPRRRTWGAAAALAAALTFAIVPRLVGDDVTQVDGVSTTADIVRASDAEAHISIVSPTDSTSVPRPGLTLMWQSAGVGVEYDVVVQDTAGNTVWSATLPDTTARVPDTARLESGRLYYWKVEARLADGRSAGTRRNQFHIQ